MESLCAVPEMCHSIMKEKERTWERRGERVRGMSSPGEFQFSLRRAFSSSSFHFLHLARGTHPPNGHSPTDSPFFPSANPFPIEIPIFKLNSSPLSLDSNPLHSERKWSIRRSALPSLSLLPSLPSLSAPSVRPLSSL